MTFKDPINYMGNAISKVIDDLEHKINSIITIILLSVALGIGIWIFLL